VFEPVGLDGQQQHRGAPPSLDVLVGPYLDQLPRDPYWGYDFLYFRDGLPAPANDLEAAEFNEMQDTWLETGRPGIWSTSSQLVQESEFTYTSRLNTGQPGRLPTYIALALGNWFPIPEKRDKGP
jgi:hypothetical protein